MLIKALTFTKTSSDRLHTTLCRLLGNKVNRTRLEEIIESRQKIHQDKLIHGHGAIDAHIKARPTQNERKKAISMKRPTSRQDMENRCEVEPINTSGRHLQHHHHQLHRVSRAERHKMSRRRVTSAEDKTTRHEHSDTTTPRVNKKSLRRSVKKTSMAPTLFATKPPVRATIVLPDEVHLGVQRPFSQYRAPTSGAKPCSPPLLENASCCAIPGEYSEQMFNGMDNYICSVTLYLYFKNAK